MEILVLGLLAMAMVVTFFVIALKLVWLGGKLLFGLVLLPFKLLGALAGLAVLPLKMFFVFALMVVVAVVGIVLLPILLPVLVVGGLLLVVIASVC